MGYLNPLLLKTKRSMNNNAQFLVNFLKHVHPMPDNIAKEITHHFEPISVIKNEALLKQGEVCNDLFILETGLVRAYTLDINGNEVTTNFITPPTLAFDIASFFKRTRSHQSMYALTHCTGWKASYPKIQILFHSIPEFREFGRANLVNCYASLQERTLSMINLTAEQRYEILIEQQPAIFQHSPLKYIASFLGVTDSSLSRIRKEIVGR